MKSVIKIQGNAFVKKDLVEKDAISAFLDITVTLIADLATVATLEVHSQLVMQRENVHVYLILLAEYAISAVPVIICILIVWVCSFLMVANAALTYNRIYWKYLIF